LRDLSFVVWEKIYGAAVQIVLPPIDRCGDCSVFDVPAGLSWAQRPIPERLAVFAGLPQREVAGIALVDVVLDPGSIAFSMRIGTPRELAVIRERGQIEVPAVIYLVACPPATSCCISEMISRI
jgi:hypothetical protein